MCRGAAMLEALNGIFAIAIYDARTQEILLARDRFGVKPLYYAVLPQAVLFASEIKAILECPTVPRQLDPQALLSHLTYLWSPAPQTILQSVRKLEPGCAMRLRQGRVVESWRYFTLPVGRTKPVSRDDAVAEVRESLRTAVHRQMVADVPIGAFLSGGVDSSAVVAFAREVSLGRLQCFTIDIGSKDAAADGITPDLPYARAMARHLDVDLHVVNALPDIAQGLEQMIYYMDEPQADPAALNVMLICQLARQQGLKVLLSGAAGDDLFSGYRRHRALKLEKFWSWLPQSLRSTLALAATAVPARPASLRRLGKAFRYADLDGDKRIASYFYWLAPELARSLFTPGFRGTSGPDPVDTALAEMPSAAAPIERMLALECRYFLADHNLAYTDKMSMACGVETRVPFLDNDLADLAFSLPMDIKQLGSTEKWVLKKAMEGILPAESIYRPKTGFGVPLRSWLHGPLREVVDDVLSERVLRERGIFEPQAVARLVAADRAGSIDASYPLLSIMCIELWCRIFLDGRAPRLNSLHAISEAAAA